MTLAAWFTIVAVCTAGAMSPGPSLAVVIRNTLRGDRTLGVITGLSHALGIVIYAFVTAIGVGVLITQLPLLFAGLRYAGALFLVWLAARIMLSSVSADARPYGDLNALPGAQPSIDRTGAISTVDAIRDGILISILNPKIILFFLALFSQFVSVETGWGEAIAIAATAGVIDAGWYVLVAVFISQQKVRGTLARHIGLIEKVFGVLLIAIAIRVVL